jgi:hypothetical protein
MATECYRKKSELNKIIGESYFNLQNTSSDSYLAAYKEKKGKWNNTDYYQLCVLQAK